MTNPIEIYQSADGETQVNLLIYYGKTFSWLQQYDEGLLSEPHGEQAAGCLKLTKHVPH